jgi:RNA polymerase sigma-70 factor, ECF subfamily
VPAGGVDAREKNAAVGVLRGRRGSAKDSLVAGQVKVEVDRTAEGPVMEVGDRVARETALRLAVLAGDARAWQAWYDEAFDGLYAYAHWRVGGLRDLADEVVQETWLTAVRRVREFDPTRGAFPAWLAGIAANILRNHLRRRHRERLRQPVTVAEGVAAESSAGQRETAEAVAHALAALPERYEAVLRAKYLERRSVAEIASASGETLKTVESLLTRARQAFRETYTRLEHGDV